MTALRTYKEKDLGSTKIGDCHRQEKIGLLRRGIKFSFSGATEGLFIYPYLHRRPV